MKGLQRIPWTMVVGAEPLTKTVAFTADSAPPQWQAMVGSGKGAHRVELSLIDPIIDQKTGHLCARGFSGSCSCRQKKNEPCRHLATVLVILEQRLDSGIPHGDAGIDQLIELLLDGSFTNLLAHMEGESDIEELGPIHWSQVAADSDLQQARRLLFKRQVRLQQTMIVDGSYEISATTHGRNRERCEISFEQAHWQDGGLYGTQLITSCDCKKQTEDHPCPHVLAALLLTEDAIASGRAPLPDPAGAGLAEPAPLCGSELPALEARPVACNKELQRCFDSLQRLASDRLTDERLIYLLGRGWRGGLVVAIRRSRLTGAGNRLAKGRLLRDLIGIRNGDEEAASPADQAIARRLVESRALASGKGAKQVFNLPPAQLHELVEELLATDRCFWADDEQQRPLRWGPPLAGRLAWRETRSRWQLITEPADDGAGLLPGTDLVLREDRIQALDNGLDADQRSIVAALPTLEAENLALAWPRLSRLLPELPTPPTMPPPLDTGPPQAIAYRLRGTCAWSGNVDRRIEVEALLPLVAYGDMALVLEQSDQGSLAEIRGRRLLRNRSSEARFRRDLHAASLRQLPLMLLLPEEWRDQADKLLINLPQVGSDAVPLAEQSLDLLRARGWHITDDPHSLIPQLPVAELLPIRLAGSAERDGGGSDAEQAQRRERQDWFDLELGLHLDGAQVDLLPAIRHLLAADADPDALPAAPGRPDHLVLDLPGHGRVAVPAAPVHELLNHLRALFDSPPAGDGPLTVHRLQGIALGDGGIFQQPAVLRQLADDLQQAPAPERYPLPERLHATLYPYQADGYRWLQHLAALGLGGILADDMGLGKTVQTLAHLQRLHETGGLTVPALVVCPASMVGVWAREAARFAPDLRVGILHGGDRHDHFDKLADFELLITTYATLTRDAKKLSEDELAAVICDEAQAIKNPQSKAAQSVRRLRCGQRLALTGTPLENHLGELWAQLDWLAPGLLGSARRFDRCFRKPIEQYGQTQRAELLRRRVAPFILRRRKDQVANELPPKTETVLPVSLGKAQRTLYESVRATVDKEIRQAMAAKGLARSQIEFLEALLRLRQVCCDPRLLKKTQHRVTDSAKLDLLMELLPTLVEDGRRIILFSQFATMLGLIGQACDDAGLAWQQLTGRTRKRQPLIDRFQAGEVPIFLISLKAGGTGLTLTAADTVIHYDPWWNPAVEDQATDRAHRIGQDKAVQVYRLIVAGSVEERVRQLQERKRRLADGLYDNDGQAVAALGEADVAALLAPLEA